ncbi:MAG: hypothetical protein QOE36_3415, partial [Gaiellaceae bacterium]|nr:hypothetical protein [Gaiellaceae bacterium]
DVQEGKLTKRFTLHSPSAGQTMAFEMNRHRVTTELAEELGSAAGARTP